MDSNDDAAAVKLLAAGAQQAKCKIMLENFCKALSGGQGADAAKRFTTAEFDRSGWFQYYLTGAAVAVSDSSADAGMKALVADIVSGFLYRAGGEFRLNRIKKHVEARYKIPFTYSDEVVKLVVSRCTESESGGRMIDAILTNTMLPDISREFLNRMMEGTPIAGVEVDATEGQFAYRFAA
jgi:hypothetical protein